MNDDWKGRATKSTPSGAVEPRRRLTTASIVGAVVAAFASSLCCLGPLLVAALGLGGAGLLVRFEPYRPYFALLTVVLLGSGFYFTYRRPKLAPAAVGGGPACHCELPMANRFGRVMLWIATVVVAGFLGFPYLAQVLIS
jgi:mercuric ion transport protein